MSNKCIGCVEDPGLTTDESAGPRHHSECLAKIKTGDLEESPGV